MFRILIAFLTLIMLNGCMQNNEARPNNGNDNQSGTMMVRDSSIEQPKRKTNEEVAEHLSEIAGSIPNVNSATTVALGDYAIVGIDVDADMERSDVGSVKYSVAEALKSDPYGVNAVVVADPDTYARLQEIREDMNDGKPISGILNELADITGRLMPNVPLDIVDQEPEEETESQKGKMDSEDKQKLNKEQEKQSNYHK